MNMLTVYIGLVDVPGIGLSVHIRIFLYLKQNI